MAGSAPGGVQDSVYGAQPLLKSLPASHSTCGMSEIKSWRYWIAHFKTAMVNLRLQTTFLKEPSDDITPGVQQLSEHTGTSTSFLVLGEVDRVEVSFSVLGTDRGSRGPGGYHSRDTRSKPMGIHSPSRYRLLPCETMALICQDFLFF